MRGDANLIRTGAAPLGCFGWRWPRVFTTRTHRRYMRAGSSTGLISSCTNGTNGNTGSTGSTGDYIRRTHRSTSIGTSIRIRISIIISTSSSLIGHDGISRSCTADRLGRSRLLGGASQLVIQSMRGIKLVTIDRERPSNLMILLERSLDLLVLE